MMESLSPEDNAGWVSRAQEAEQLFGAIEDWLVERAQLDSIELIKTEKDPMSRLSLIASEKNNRLETIRKAKDILAEFMVDHMPPMSEEERALKIKQFIANIKSRVA